MHIDTKNMSVAVYIDYFKFHKNSAILYYDDLYYIGEVHTSETDEVSLVSDLTWRINRDDERYVTFSSAKMTR